MSKSKSPVFEFDGSDPEMQRAYERARATFKYFWRELAWEYRRIIPALDVAAVKAPFSDGRGRDPKVEHMWFRDIEFDGKVVSGTLLNSPNQLKSVKAGDAVELPLDRISDWMYAFGGEVYGAHTVSLMRARMGAKERKQHDAAWGLDFGDPGTVRLVPRSEAWGDGDPDQEHPMSANMAESLTKHLAENPEAVNGTDDRGWTFLHSLALAGSAAGVKVLLDAGSDPHAVTDHGMTALRLAHALGWENVVALLMAAGAK